MKRVSPHGERYCQIMRSSNGMKVILIGTNTNTAEMFIIKKSGAFVADYARLIILREHGGIYLDTDMFVLRPLMSFLNNELVLGKEDETHISAGMIACVPGNVFIDKCLEYYNP